MRPTFNVLALVASTCALVLPAPAKEAGYLTGNGHNGDIVRVLGMLEAVNTDTIAWEKAQGIVDEFARCIDGQSDATALLYNIRSVAPDFTWSSYGHRLFSHWGFNGDPRHSKPLREQVEKSSDDPLVRDAVWARISAEQSNRNRRMMNAMRRGCMNAENGRCELKREEINALSAIVYDTHMLGDYIEGTSETTKPLTDLRAVRKDIVKSAETIVRAADPGDFPEGMLTVELANFKKDMVRAYSSKFSEQNKASAMLETCKAELPPILAKSKRVKKALRIKL